MWCTQVVSKYEMFFIHSLCSVVPPPPPPLCDASALSRLQELTDLSALCLLFAPGGTAVWAYGWAAEEEVRSVWGWKGKREWQRERIKWNPITRLVISDRTHSGPFCLKLHRRISLPNLPTAFLSINSLLSYSLSPDSFFDLSFMTLPLPLFQYHMK